VQRTIIGRQRRSKHVQSESQCRERRRTEEEEKVEEDEEERRGGGGGS
jgi:hypothetical protein